MSLDLFLREANKTIDSSEFFKPHKYILLLVVIELRQEGYFRDNKIFYDEELKRRFKKYIELYGSKSDRNRAHTPFFHLKSSGFWHLKPKPGREEILSILDTVGSPKDIIENIDYAYLDESAYHRINDTVKASKLKDEIISILENYKDKSTIKEAKADKIIENVDDSVDFFVCEKPGYLYDELLIISFCMSMFARDSTTINKCIEHHGAFCHVCSMDFLKVYGELGKGFIHIHHLAPQNIQKNNYKVNYKTDLIPVCPNCHAMLHRKYKGKHLSIDELKNLIQRQSKNLSL